MLPPGKEIMSNLFAVFAGILLIETIANDEKDNKKIYCFGFAVCVIAATILRGGMT